MNQSPTQEHESEKELELKAALAEAAVRSEAKNLRSAVGQLTQAIPQAAPIHAINTIGRISTGVEVAVDHAENFLSKAISHSGPVARASRNAVARVRANPIPFALAAVGGLIGLIYLMRNSRSLRKLT